jgi:hypothetical protein
MKTQIIQDDSEGTAARTAAAPPPASGAGRTAGLVVGIVAAVLGAVLALSGVAVLAAFGSDGVVSTGRGALSTPASAFMSQTAAITDTAGASDVLGDTSIRVSARAAAGRPMFVGVGPARAVEGYLSGAAVDEITDFELDPFSVDRRRLGGTATPPDPAGQSFWVARASGRTADVHWKVRDGDYRVVIMNADGARGVSTQASLGAEVPNLPDIAVGILVAGLLLAGGGAAAIVLSRRGRGERS